MNTNALFKIGYGLYALSAHENGKDNACIVNAVMQVTSEPLQVAVCVNKNNYTCEMIQRTKKFNVSVLAEGVGFDVFKNFGYQCGRDVDKFSEMKLTKESGSVVAAPMIKESPVNIECKVREVKELGSHHMFLADVVAVHVDDQYMDEKQKFDLGMAGLLAYSHGEYYNLGKQVGTFGYSVKKKKKHENTKKKKSKT